MTLSTAKSEIITAIIQREGGDKFTDDPNDSGGATRFGVTEKVARKAGYQGHMRDFPYELAVKVYEGRYLDAVRFDDLYALSPMIAEEVADTGVNCGVRLASKHLQRCLNLLNNRGAYYPDIATDGHIGGKTLQALTAFISRRDLHGISVLFSMLNCLQGAFYIDLAEERPKDESFIYGWFSHRVLNDG